MSSELPDIQKILTLLREAGWTEAHLKFGDFELSVSDSPLSDGAASAAPAPTKSPAPTVLTDDAPPATTDRTVGIRTGDADVDAPHSHTIEAPSIGVFWRSPQPGAPPFVEVGDTVEPDTTVCIVEVMKLMTHIKAGSRGVVRAIHVDNGGMVEYGDALISIDKR